MKKIITWFIDNPVISNLLMILIIIGGFLTISNLKMEVFPSFELDAISISVVYPGASSEDIEKSICIPIEESIYGISGIKKITSNSSEGYGIVIVEVMAGEDPEAIKDKITSKVESLSSLPKESERPTINRIERNNGVLSVAISGDVDELSLDRITNEIKDDLDAIDGISLTSIAVEKPKNISIKISRETMMRHGISIDDINRAVKNSSIEMPAGKLENNNFQKVIKVNQRAYLGKDIANIKMVPSSNPESYVRIGDIAEIVDGFEESEIELRFNKKPGSVIMVFRIANQNALDIASKVESYIEDKSKELPSGVELKTWNDESKYLKGRLDLLLKNAWIGLILVMFVLSLFLKPKLAFWVSLGIPISFLGAIWLFPFLDVSINMLSLFTFILVLGIVVDDAIVVGENFYKYKELGENSRDAAIKGTYEISKPVIFAILTTMATFSPMLFVEGASGKIWKIFPLVVIPILFFSLFESLTILPFHLAHSKDRSSKIKVIKKLSLFFKKIRKKLNYSLKLIIKKYYSPFLKKCLKYNWITLSSFLSIFILTLGLIYSGYIKFNFFPGLESDIIFAQIEFPDGTPIEKTEEAVLELENSLRLLEIEYDKKNDSSEGIILNTLTVIGGQPYKSATSGRGEAMESSYSGANLAEVAVELSPGENRDFKSSDIANRWREITPEIEGIKDLKFSSSLFSAGEDINFRFSSDNIEELVSIVEDFEKILKRYPGVYDVFNNNNKGSSELLIKLLPKAEYYNINMSMIYKQIRDSFHGVNIVDFQRGRDEISVEVSYLEDDKNSIIDLENLEIATALGTSIPLKIVCDIEMRDGYSSINRVDRKRSLSVIGAVDAAVSNSNDIISSIEKNDLPELLKKYPSVTYALEGQQREQSENLSSLTRNYVIALFVVFLLLAIPFKSYYQPLIIMSAIPYGIIGAVMGHLLLGMDFSILSMLGIAALSGIVVNDSLVMMDYINRNKQKSGDNIQAALDAGPMRFRAILLTSITTFMGVLPLIFEKSIQAKFLVPMAVSLGFGVLFSTLVTLILVPTTYVTFEQVKELFIKKIKNTI